jgi:diguanylate cyclase (GGDEF)-like protein
MIGILAPLTRSLTLPLHGRAAGRIWRERSRRGAAWVPVLFGCGATSFVVGQGIAAYARYILHRSASFPSWADAGYLGAYPFLLVAVLLLLGAHPLPRASRTRVLLDSLMTTAAAAPFAWYFILGPTIFRPNEAALAKLVGGAYTVCDLALVFVALLLSARLGDPALRRMVSALAPALTIIAVADSVYAYHMTHHGYATGEFLDLTRSLGYIVLGCAATVARFTVPRQRHAGDAPAGSVASSAPHLAMRHVWRYLLPYALIPAVVALIASMGHAQVESRVETGVYLTAALLIELVFVHQLLAYRELIAHSNRSARFESLAGADPVTGLPNHRTLVSALDRELERSHRYHHPCVFLFLDLDHFKALNDTFGHVAGDAALREFSSVVRTALRSTDTLGRWGGEEFVAMLPETDVEAGLAVAERVRRMVAAHGFCSAGGAHITCCVGLATSPQDAQDRDGLIAMADQAMYAAKRLGRNQVRAAGDPVVTAQAAETRKPGSREEAALAGMVEALAALVDARDHCTGQHVDTVAGLTVRLALALELDTSQAHLVGLAGRLHDIGKLAIPDAVLRKPASLTEDEWTLMRTHPGLGAAVVSRVPALRALAPIIRAHHERWDGQGYPDRLAGDAIPLLARVLAVADALSAMRTDRPYQRACSAEAALAELRRCRGTQFDPHVVDAMERLLMGEPMLLQGEGAA